MRIGADQVHRVEGVPIEPCVAMRTNAHDFLSLERLVRGGAKTFQPKVGAQVAA